VYIIIGIRLLTNLCCRKSSSMAGIYSNVSCGCLYYYGWMHTAFIHSDVKISIVKVLIIVPQRITEGWNYGFWHS